jgi:hypothetical protein
MDYLHGIMHSGGFLLLHFRVYYVKLEEPTGAMPSKNLYK